MDSPTGVIKRLTIRSGPTAHVEIDYHGRTMRIAAPVAADGPNRRVLTGDQLQSLIAQALADRCESIELLRLTVTPRTEQAGGIVLRDAALQRLAIIGCDFEAGL